MSTFRFVVCPKPQSYTLHGLSPYAGTYVEECTVLYSTVRVRILALRVLYSRSLAIKSTTELCRSLRYG